MISLPSHARSRAYAVLCATIWLSACMDEEPAPTTSVALACTGACDAGAPGATALPATGAPGGGSPVASSPAPIGTPVGTSALGAGRVTGEGSGATPAASTGGASAGDGVPCEVKKIVEQRCASCHGATPMSAPMSLVTSANWHAASERDKSKQYYQLAKQRINASDNPMPPPAIGSLSASEKQTLNAWLDQGAPSSSTACAASPSGSGSGANVAADAIDVSGLECFKLLAHAPGNKAAKFKVGAAVDKYMNFGFQAPWQGMLYGVVVRPVIDNARALHHWLIYRESVQDGSVSETIGQHSGGELIHGWAPGGLSMDFRKHGDVSFELPSTTYSIEVHYNSSDANAADASGVELCGVRKATKNIASLSWLGYDQGGTLSYASGICFDQATSWTGTCKPTAREPIHMLFVTPHLHQAGRHLKAVINGPNGSRTLHDKPFDFNYQITYETEEVLMPGESVTTTCTFSEPKCAGQATSQEMCYLFTYAWPKKALIDNGPEGTFMHGDGVCLGQ